MVAKIFEYLLWRGRLFVLVAVVASMVAAILMVLLGALSVFWELRHFSVIFTSADALDTAHRSLTVHAISAMDTFLIATVLFIFSIGLYDLFVRKIDMKTADSPELVVTSLEQLKEKLVKVILIVLVVTFFKAAISFSYTSAVDLLYLAIAVLLISVAMFLSHFKKKDH